MPRVIDLDRARTSKSARVFSGRDRGRFWRKEFRLDELDEAPEGVIVKIPEDVLSVNLSFFLSLFGDSVRLLGQEGFRRKYHFECDPALEPLINQGVEQATKKSSVLPSIA